MNAVVKIDKLSFAYNGKPVLSGVSVEIAEGERWAIIGRNGAGKSTLIRCLAGLEPVKHGEVRIRGKKSTRYSARELARVIAYVPQAPGRAMPFSVADYVLMGRFPYQGFLATPSSEDKTIMCESLKLTDTSELAHRRMDTLSGGELQRVLLAGAVSQRADILLLDEPTTFLDPLHHELLYRALDRIHNEFNTTVVTVTHQVNDAIERHNNILALVGGGCHYAGSAVGILQKAPEIFEEIYGIGFEEVRGAVDGRRLLMPSWTDKEILSSLEGEK